MRILLVEDEEKVSRFIVCGLVAERFAVDAAKDGDTGLQQAICLAHGGEVQVESTEGRGSLFLVSLPLADLGTS